MRAFYSSVLMLALVGPLLTGAAPTAYHPVIRLWQTTATYTAPPCDSVVIPMGMNYTHDGEAKYRLDYMTANGSGTVCLADGLGGPPVCTPTCAASPCQAYAPVNPSPARLPNHLTLTLYGESGLICYIPAIVWDLQLSIGP